MIIPAQNQKLFLKLRSTRDCLWLRHSKPGYALDGFELTEQAGAYGLAVQSSDDLYTDMPIALVNTLSDFWQAEFFGETEPIGAFVHVEPDQYPDLVAWLQRCVRAPKLYLFFNYDAAGLDQMARFLAAVPEAQVYLPHNLNEAWDAHSRINLFDPLQFERVKKGINVNHSAVETIVRLMTKTQKAMRLESLVLTAKLENW